MSRLRVVAGAVGTTVGACVLLMATSWFFATMPLWVPVVAISLGLEARRRTRAAQPEVDRGN